MHVLAYRNDRAETAFELVASHIVGARQVHKKLTASFL